MIPFWSQLKKRNEPHCPKQASDGGTCDLGVVTGTVNLALQGHGGDQKPLKCDSHQKRRRRCHRPTKVDKIEFADNVVSHPVFIVGVKVVVHPGVNLVKQISKSTIASKRK